MNQEKKNEILAKIIYKKDYDVPDWVYDALNEDILMEILRMEYLARWGNIHPTVEDFIEFIDTPKIVNFFNRARGHSLFNHIYDQLIGTIYEDSCILLFDTVERSELKSLIKRTRKYKIEVPDIEEFFVRFLNIAISSKQYQFQLPAIIKTIKMNPYELLTFVMNSRYEDGNNSELETLASLLGANTNYGLFLFCNECDIPVYFKYSGITEVMIYLDSILESKSECLIDDAIAELLPTIEDEDAIYTRLLEIGTKLNQNNLIYLAYLPSFQSVGVERMFQLLDMPQYLVSETNQLQKFSDLITICGRNQYGLPIELQKLFLKHGGSIETMYQDGKLLPEASIVKDPDEFTTLMSLVSDEDIEFLINHSAEFVKNFLSSSWTTLWEMVRIGRVLFEFPVNADLWNALNHKTGTFGIHSDIDYRDAIARKLIVNLSLEGLFDNVPQALAYFTPSVLYITRNLSAENIPYIPVTYLTPYLKSIIGNPTYTKLNLFCNGEQVSITSAVGDYKFLVQNIAKYEKYEYICDITDIDPIVVIDTIANNSGEVN